MTTDARIDDYIAAAPLFARPILTHLRKLVHEAEPRITETIKWGAPFFEYKGMVCSMAAFKQHCVLNFPKYRQMKDAALFEQKNTEGGGQFGRLTAMDKLPPGDLITGYIKEAVAINENPSGRKKEPGAQKEVLYYPDGLKEALTADGKAGTFFDTLSYSHRKEYIEWIAEAKTDATRSKRIATTLEWLQEGKRRNWKYEKKG